MIGNSWDDKLSIIWQSEGFHSFYENVLALYKTKTIFPKEEDIFAALKLTPFENVKVVIIGQDPYFNFGKAHGLSFSVPDNFPIPPSLQNIYKELEADLNITPNKSGNLTKWAQEGVLLLNAILTVEEDKPASHKNLGWELLTDYIIKAINSKEEPVVFILWGNFAKAKKDLITNKKHLILKSSHPSPFACRKGFFGSKPFSKTNAFLLKNNISPINWDLSK